MARRKADWEVGALGVWAYNTARLLGQSSEQVAHDLHVDDASIRKIEGGSNKKPSPALIQRMYQHFVALGQKQGLPIEPPPNYQVSETAPATDSAAIVAAINAQTDVLRELVSALGRMDQSVTGGLIGLGDALGAIHGALGGTLPRSEPVPAGRHGPDDSTPARPSNPRVSAQ